MLIVMVVSRRFSFITFVADKHYYQAVSGRFI